MNHIVALSGGKDSTAMALRLKEVEPREYIYAITPTGNELPEMYEHWKMLSDILEAPLKVITTGRSLQSEIERQNAIPSWRMRWCTRMLKIEPYNAFLKESAPAVSYVGLRADEPDSVRRGMVLGNVEGISQRWPMREWGWTIGDVWDYLDSKGVAIPQRTDCALCFFQRGAEWWNLWRNHPEIYAKGEALEELTGHTFRAPGGNKDKHPTALKDLRKSFEKGVLPKGAGQLSLMDARQGMCRTCEL